ncbi:glycine-rich protein A3-like [Cynara cardunculus var. scolymus]|uniref:glycine-rich protein A3-like n=1 Tax=Cynara cardunculus var. scolymus TaxID=59895 RepID=UPI000D62ECEB|nr:glycine-rich protein A3-like [Cynara cardunculus var. scolymus]
MGDGYHRHNRGKGLLTHLVGTGQYPPQGYAYPPQGYPYPPPGGYPQVDYPPHGGYPPPPHVCPLPNAYSPATYHGASAPCNPGHGGHKHGLGTFLAGGAAAMAAACGSHHTPHGYGSHGSYGYYGNHYGRYKHGKFKHAKFGKRWKHRGIYGKHKMWK